MDQSRMTFLQNVLRYSTSHSDGTTPSSEESHVREMSPERKKWLENALDNMSINPVEEMKKCIKCLNDPAQEENHLTALETLRDWCEDMNFAIDFHKLNQYPLLFTLLNSDKPEIRALTCDLIGALAQNNEYCQETLLSSKIMPLILQKLDKDTDEVKIKALYALSCLCRDYTPGQEKLMEGNGIDILMRALKSPVEKLQLKCCFLFAAICGSNSRLKDLLTDKKLVEDLIELYRQPESTIHEQVLSAINVLVDENPKAVKQAIEMKDVDFKTILRNRIEATSDDPRFSEECDMAKSLLDKFFKN